MTDPIERSDFEALVREHHAAVFRSAMRILRDDEDAADVTQQVFLRVLEGKEHVADARDAGRVLRWLAAKSALAHARETGTRRRKETEGAMGSREHVHPDPSARSSHAEEEGALRRFLHALPDELRHALLLRFQEEMTFADIAQSQGCSEPTAHERVKKGLERLRLDLSRAGFAAVVAGLPERLAHEEAFAVPAHLQAKLLALSGKGAVVAAGAPHAVAMAAAAFLAIGVVGGGILLVSRAADARRAELNLARQRESEASSIRVNGTDPESRANAEISDVGRDTRTSLGAGAAASTAEPSSAVAATGKLVGRVVDEHGAGLAGVRVLADSLERAGKFSAIQGTAESAADGRFSMDLDVHVADGQEFHLRTESPDLVAVDVASLRVRVGATTDAGTLELHPNSADRPGEYDLTVRLADASGSPVPSAIVRVFRRLKEPSGEWRETMEAHGVSNALGFVEMHGTRLGAKTVRVDARSRGLERRSEEFAIDAAGRQERSIVLAQGLTIRGTIVVPDGKSLGARTGSPSRFPNPIYHFSCWAEEGEEWLQATIEDDGRFAFVGLEDRPYTLFLSSGIYSPMKLLDVRPSGDEVTVVLKRTADTVNRGDHMAEIHGRVRDARTGAPVTVDDFELECVDVPDLPLAEHVARTLPTLLEARPVQRMITGDEPPPTAEFHCVGLEPGTYVVVVRKAPFGPAFSPPITLGRTDVRSDVVIELPGAGSIAGVVLDADGKPLAGAIVATTGTGEPSASFVAALDTAVRQSGGQGYLGAGCYVRADDQGRFRFDRLPPALDLHFAAMHPRFEPTISPGIRVKEGEARAGVDLRLVQRREP